MELETAFYTIGIIFMCTMLALIVAMLYAVLVIKAKINYYSKMIESRLNKAKSVAKTATIGLNTVRFFLKK